MFLTEEELKPLTPEQSAKNRKRFEWLIAFLICRYHFVHRILGIMQKREAEIGTMGVRMTSDQLIELLTDSRMTFWLEDAELTYIFYHEVLHVALHHCDCRQNSDPLWGVAIDLEVNELIEEVLPDICKRPAHKDGSPAGTFVSEYKKDKRFHDIKEKQTAEWYYAYLRERVPHISLEFAMTGGGGGQKKIPKGHGKNEMPGEQTDDHGGWRQSEVQAEKVRALIKVIGNTDSWGSMSQGLKEIIKAAQVRKINWRNYIRHWFGAHAWKTRETTRKRPNRRTGYMFPGTRKQYVDRWLVAVDTSGSISDDLLAEWVGVLNQLVEELPIDVMQFDCDKQESPHPYDRRRDHFEFTGRGGTSFVPAIEQADKGHYKGLMLLTDGDASACTAPARARVLWVMPKGCHLPTGIDWGDKVYLERNC